MAGALDVVVSSFHAFGGGGSRSLLLRRSRSRHSEFSSWRGNPALGWGRGRLPDPLNRKELSYAGRRPYQKDRLCRRCICCGARGFADGNALWGGLRGDHDSGHSDARRRAELAGVNGCILCPWGPSSEAVPHAEQGLILVAVPTLVITLEPFQALLGRLTFLTHFQSKELEAVMPPGENVKGRRQRLNQVSER